MSRKRKRGTDLARVETRWLNRRKVTLTLLALFLIASFLWSLLKPESLPPPTTNPNPIYAYHNRIREAVLYVARGHKDAESLYRLLIERGVDAYVDSSGKTTYANTQPLPNNKFYLLVVQERSREVFYTALVVEENGLLRLETFADDLTPEWLGINILHELRHVREQLVDKSPWAKSQEESFNDFYVDIELAAHELELELANKLSKGEFLRRVGTYIKNNYFLDPNVKTTMSVDYYLFVNSLFKSEVSEVLERRVRVIPFLYAYNKARLEKQGLDPKEKREALRNWQRQIMNLATDYGRITY